MKKNVLKLCINVLLFIDLCSVGMIGLLLAFVIPKGGPRSGDNVFLWLHRHEWSDIHQYLALVFFLILFIHVWFNWTWVTQSFKRYFGDAWRKVLLLTAVAWVFVLLVGWIVAKM